MDIGQLPNRHSHPMAEVSRWVSKQGQGTLGREVAGVSEQLLILKEVVHQRINLFASLRQFLCILTAADDASQKSMPLVSPSSHEEFTVDIRVKFKNLINSLAGTSKIVQNNAAKVHLVA